MKTLIRNAEVVLPEGCQHVSVLIADDKIADIEKASRRAADLCKQMLAFSGRGHFTVEGLDLSALLNEISQLLEVTISKKAVLECSLPEDVPPIEADTTQIRQIIMNLITNATEAIGDRGGIISISTGAVECDRAYLNNIRPDEELPEGAYVSLSISDTGAGVEEETQKRIDLSAYSKFGMFEQWGPLNVEGMYQRLSLQRRGN